MGTKQNNELITTLKNRFEKNMARHQGIEWSAVEKKTSSWVVRYFATAAMAKCSFITMVPTPITVRAVFAACLRLESNCTFMSVFITRALLISS